MQEVQESIILLNNCVNEINLLLDQVQSFIGQFNSVITTYHIAIITDSFGNMDMEIPSNLSDEQALNIRNRVGIIDRLINTQGTEAKLKIEKGLSIFHKIKASDSEFKSEILNQVYRFKELNRAYAH